jgi:hypothetical protein
MLVYGILELDHRKGGGWQAEQRDRALGIKTMQYRKESFPPHVGWFPNFMKHFCKILLINFCEILQNSH